MPKAILPIEELEHSVLRPVVFAVLDQISETTGIKADRVLFPGDIGAVPQEGSSVQRADKPVVRLPGIGQLYVEVEEALVVEDTYGITRYDNDQPFIFQDQSLQTWVRPIYANQRVTLNFKYRATDKTTAKAWMDAMIARMANHWDVAFYTVKYGYLIPGEFLYILREIHSLREARAGYGDTWDEYWKAFSTIYQTELTTLDGKHTRKAVVETQQRTQGYFEVDLLTEKGEAVDSQDTWITTAKFQYQYSKPIAASISYPWLIHQQHIPDELYTPDDVALPTDRFQRAGKYQAALSYFEAGRLPPTGPNYTGLAIPSYDDFIAPPAIPDTTRVYNALIALDETNPWPLMNIVDVEGITFKPQVVDFLKGERKHLLNRYASVFYVNIYKDNYVSDGRTLRITDDMTLISSAVLDPRVTWRVRLSLVTSLRILPREATDRLRRYPDAARAILSAIYPNVRVRVPAGTLGIEFIKGRHPGRIGLGDVPNDSRGHYPDWAVRELMNMKPFSANVASITVETHDANS